MTEESKEVSKHRNLWIKDRIEHLLGMLICIHLALVFWWKSYNLLPPVGTYDYLYFLFTYRFSSLALGLSPFLFGYKLILPVTFEFKGLIEGLVPGVF